MTHDMFTQMRTADTAPMINAPGTSTSVIIGGQIKKKDRKLVEDIKQSEERILARSHSKPIPLVACLPLPSLSRSCCPAEHPYLNLRF
jgi:hypothetical protein